MAVSALMHVDSRKTKKTKDEKTKKESDEQINDQFIFSLFVLVICSKIFVCSFS